MREFLRRRPVLSFSLAAVLTFACLVWALFVLGRPLPPRTVVMSTGPEGGAYREHGEKYRAALAKDRIHVKLAPSLGNVENLKRLKDASSGVSAAFVTGGLTSETDSPGLVSLGTISYDPVWIFCRGLPEPVQLRDLRGKRVSIGPEGGGTRAVMLELLAANGIVDAITPLALSPGPGGEALLRGELDCACMITAPEGPIVKKLLADERVALVTFPRADAYVALFPHLSKVTVPRGVGSLAKDRPPEDRTLLAPMSSLLVREDLHPAIQFLLLEAASDIHSGPGIFRKAGQFPAAEPVDVPLSKEAHAFYKSGGSFLQRHLPFWLAVIAQRLLLIALPVAGILYPLARVIHDAMEFAVEQRLKPLYVELRAVEARIAAGEPGAAAALAALEERVTSARVPARHARSLYWLKQHVALVRERLRGPTMGRGDSGGV